MWQDVVCDQEARRRRRRVLEAVERLDDVSVRPVVAAVAQEDRGVLSRALF